MARAGDCFLAQEVCGSNLQGAYNVKEAYAEIFIPVLKDIPFIHSLNVTLGDRYSKYNTFGNTNNWKIGVEWRPIEDLLLRGTVSSVFRAPTIGNLYAGPSGGAPTARDPCENLSAAQLAQLPGCAGVPPFLPPAQNSQLTGVVSGSQYAGYPLGPESGKSFDFGVVYDRGWLEGLSVSSDVWPKPPNTPTRVASPTRRSAPISRPLVVRSALVALPSPRVSPRTP